MCKTECMESEDTHRHHGSGFGLYSMLNSGLDIAALLAKGKPTVADVADEAEEERRQSKLATDDEERKRRHAASRKSLMRVREYRMKESAARDELMRKQTQVRKFVKLLPMKDYMLENVLWLSDEYAAMASDPTSVLPLNVIVLHGVDEPGLCSVEEHVERWLGVYLPEVRLRKWFRSPEYGSAAFYNLSMLLAGVPVLVISPRLNGLEGSVEITVAYWEATGTAHPLIKNVAALDYSPSRPDVFMRQLETAVKLLVATANDCYLLANYGTAPRLPGILASDAALRAEFPDEANRLVARFCMREYAALIRAFASDAGGMAGLADMASQASDELELLSK